MKMTEDEYYKWWHSYMRVGREFGMWHCWRIEGFSAEDIYKIYKVDV